MAWINRTIIGLARLSQEGSRQNAHLGSQKLRKRRRMIEENPDLIAAIAHMAPDLRAANKALDIMAAHSELTHGLSA